MSALASIRRAAAWIAAGRRRIAMAWALAAFVTLAALSGAPGVSRDEAALLAAGEKSVSAVRTAPPAATLARAAHAAGARGKLGHLRSSRLGTALAGALIAALVAALGWDLAGRAGALLAPASFWLAPRHLGAGLTALPDLPLAALLLAAACAYRRSAGAPDRRRALPPALLAGALFGAALAARPDGWILLPALALHAALVFVLARRARPAATAPAAGARFALVAMAVLGPAAALLLWGVPWRTPLATAAAAFAPAATARFGYLGSPLEGVLPAAYPFVVGALATPAALLWTYATGLLHALSRAARAFRLRAQPGEPSDDLLLAILAAAPFAAAASGALPALSGIRPWLPAMPFLSLLGARALLAAARSAWPSRQAQLAGALAILVLYPALRQTVHVLPQAASSWNEIAGGAPGAASLGMQSQDGGEAAAALLPALAARASPGARIWWAGVDPAAVRLYSMDGRLRPDLEAAPGPEEADLAVVALDWASRDAEYHAWTAFRTSRPAAGVYLDEVPLAFVYARHGAWR